MVNGEETNPSEVTILLILGCVELLFGILMVKFFTDVPTWVEPLYVIQRIYKVALLFVDAILFAKL